VRNDAVNYGIFDMSKKLQDPEAESESRRYSDPIASRQLILQVMENIAEPVAFKRLAKELNLEVRGKREALKNRLRAMVREGQLVVDRRNIYALAGKMEIVRGRVSGHSDGFGFLITGNDDVFLPHRQMRSVFDGDIALVQIRGTDRRGRPIGDITEVLERNTTELVGRLYVHKDTWLLESLNTKITQEILVQVSGAEIDGQIVSASVIDQPSPHGMPTCVVREVLGEHLSAEMEIKVSLLNNDIPSVFSPEVLSEASEMPSVVSAEDKHHREDLTSLPFVTIDGADAKDFDDAIYCEKRSRGGWRLIVAIADVSHYVRVSSQLDESAMQRGTSVYFPQYVVPMLPTGISNELCSLKPKVDRLVLTCEMQISATGRISKYEFYESVICSAARLTYDEVAAGEVDSPSLVCARDLVDVLLSKREVRGALDFDTAELSFTLDPAGNIDAISKRQRNDAMQLIEECMLCANVCAARFMQQLSLPGLYRVHEKPSEEKLAFLRKFLDTLGINLSEGSPTPGELQRVLDELRNRKNGHILQLSVLRSLSQAVYQVQNVGHYGLNYPNYTHFTSPIRRYPDLLTHRLIKSVIHSELPTDLVRRQSSLSVNEFAYEPDQLQTLASHCSTTERRAETAVYQVIEWMKCEYMAKKIGDTEPGVITHVTNFGFFVQLEELYVEGLVHVSNLSNDYYVFDQEGQCLVGEHGGLSFGIGDDVTVQIARVSVDEQKIDFDLISHQGMKRRRKRRGKRK